MKQVLRAAVLSLAVAATTLGSVAVAEAGHRHRHNDAIAAGVLGLAAGAIVGGLLASPPRGPVYIDPPYRPVQPDYYPVYRQPVYRPYRPAYYRDSLEPWTGSWYRYCSARYRSFDPASGTFMGYDGRRHFCQP